MRATSGGGAPGPRTRGALAPPPRKIAVERLDLGRGLEAVVARLPHLSRATATLYLRTGPLYEHRARGGISHFLEHMLHRGTSVRLADAHAQAVAFERLGANLDAATGTDHGLLGTSCPPESLDDVLSLLGEVATQPALRDIDVERGIVREELLEGLDEKKRLVDADVLLRALVFGDHALGRPILGTLGSLERFDVRSLRRHHARHYVRGNVVLSLAGRLPPTDALERTLRRAFRHLPTGPALRAPHFAQPVGGPRLHVVPSVSSQTSVRLGFLAPGRNHRDEPAVELLLRILDDGTGTRLYERLCDRQGLCYDTSASYEPFEGVGLFDLAAETAPARAGRVVAELVALVLELRARGVRDEEHRRALDRSFWQARGRTDAPEGVADQLGLSMLHGAPRTPLEHHARLAAVGRAELDEVARRLLRPEHLSLVLVGPVSRATEDRARRVLKDFKKRAAGGS
jgi:predicted Zn-dependent peptidase